MLDVYLILMPYAAVERPSLALGLLKAGLVRQGFSAKVCYANIRFAEYIGLPNYYFLSYTPPRLLVGEWTFAGAAFPDFQPDHEQYLCECEELLMSAQYFMNIREKAPAFIDRIANEILSEKPKIVGCSSTFQQNCASLAILKRIKTLHPEIITMMGGANCEGSMGLMTHQCFDWVDYVISGEADDALPELCRTLIRSEGSPSQRELPAGIYGPSLRGKDRSSLHVARVVVSDLETAPVPIYDEYFETLHASALSEQIKPGLAFETSRGCWWGQQHQCTFCGISDQARIFRMKSAPRILSELKTLSRQYRLNKFMATDSIFSLQYFDTVLPELVKGDERYTLFFETIAGMSKTQVRQMADAGIRWIQPGIESLHDQILRLMNKGTRAWKNIQLLKWCLEYGISVGWNFLVNVPGDDAEWYLEMASWLPFIAHLQPPLAMFRLRYDRFSRFHQDPESFHLDLEPFGSYSAVYPLSSIQLRDFAYFFNDVSPQSDDAANEKSKIFYSLSQLVATWQNGFFASRPDIIKREVSASKPELSMRNVDHALHITDTRPCAVQRDILLEGLTREIYLACDDAMTPEQLVKHLQQQNNCHIAWNDIQPILDHLLEQKILLRLDNRLISLALSEKSTPIPTHEDDPSGLVILPRAKNPE